MEMSWRPAETSATERRVVRVVDNLPVCDLSVSVLASVLLLLGRPRHRLLRIA